MSSLRCSADQDGSLEFSRIRYNVSGDSSFEILPDGSVQSVFSFDYEFADPCYNFNITATDDGGLMGVALVEACLEDTNDNCPQFDRSEYVINIPENSLSEKALFNLSAIDYDSRSDFSSVVIFDIESNDTFITGIISLVGNQLFLRRA